MAEPAAVLPWYFVGPHGFYDLVRLARRGRSVVVRVLYVLALFAALTIGYYDAGQSTGGFRTQSGPGRPQTPHELRADSINHNARVAERFCVAILVMQNIAVLLLTPIYMAASIQEERDKGTFPLLFTTQLTPQSIILGKWVSRCAHVGVTLLAGLPILSFVQLWGGIDMPMIAANFYNTALMLSCVGALSLWIAVRTRTMLRAVGVTYLTMSVLAMCCCLPIGASGGPTILLLAPFGDGTHNYGNMWIVANVCVGVWVVLTVGFLRRTGVVLAALRTDEGPRWDKPDWHGLDVPRNRFRRWPVFSDNMIAWKERYLDRNFFMIVPYAFLPYMVSLSFAYGAIALDGNSRERETLERIFKFFLLGMFSMYALTVAWRITGSVVRERQQRTLEPLLTMPITRHEILRQKIVGNLQRQLGWLWPAGVAAVMSILFARGHREVVLLLGLVLAVHSAFFVALAAYLTVHCRTIVSAYVWLGVILFLMFVGMPIAASFFGLPDALTRGWIPFYCWLTIAEEWWREGVLMTSTAASIAEATLCYALAAVALWRVACGHFERDPG